MVRMLPAIALVLAVTGSAAAQSGETDDLQGRVEETVDAARQTQRQQDRWAGDREQLEVRYRAARANIAYLEETVARRREKAAALDDAVAELNRRLDESGRLQAVIQDTLDATLGRLEKVVARDLPFLPEERSARLQDLRRELAEPDVVAAEKLRRLLEAMLVEAQYGETVEVTPRTVEIRGQEVHADVLRIGRLAMFWKSPDGNRVGTWDPEAEAWTDLPGSYARIVTRAMEMASRMRPVALIALPLGSIDLPGEVQR